MKFIDKIREKLSSLVRALSRYPLTVAFLVAAAVANVQGMGNAQVGDKTLIDTLVPALAAYREALAGGSTFAAALQAMSAAAEAGKDSTKNLQARIGRSARLGARSIGVLDAGATSCWLILRAMAQALGTKLPS